jgi:type II secretory pathway component PulM
MTLALNRQNPRRSGLRERFAAWVRGPTLARDIAIVLAIKFVLLMALKYAFFNHPQAEHMSLPPEQVAQALLSAPASNPSQGDHHAR